jgi:hypothetical protein
MVIELDTSQLGEVLPPNDHNRGGGEWEGGLMVVVVVVVIIEAETKIKYRNLSIEIQWMWNMKCFVTPVNTGAIRIVNKSLKNLETIPGQHSTDSLKERCTRNITHHKESATIWDLKPEWWGWPLAQEGKHQGRKKSVIGKQIMIIINIMNNCNSNYIIVIISIFIITLNWCMEILIFLNISRDKIYKNWRIHLDRP